VRDHKFQSLYSPDVSLPVSVSMGVSVLEKGQDEDLFLQSADAALYRAKKMGRNRAISAQESRGKSRRAEPLFQSAVDCRRSTVDSSELSS
jgi:predicted signal transduction protein with EAL and GGDEF domain